MKQYIKFQTPQNYNFGWNIPNDVHLLIEIKLCSPCKNKKIY